MRKECKALWEREFAIEDYKKYRVSILEDLYIRLDEYQMKHLEGLTNHNDVDAYLNDIIMNSKQNNGPTVEEIVNKAYNKQVVNQRRTRMNALKKAARETSRQ